jgi:Neuraminidase (sialidase)
MSDNGADVYISFNGPTGGDPYATVSHDAGATWTPTKLVNSRLYYFAFDADVASDGTVYFSESALDYGSAGKHSAVNGTIQEHVFISRDRGATWEDKLVATVSPGIVCVAEGCTPDFYVGHTALSVDAAGALVVLYDGATTGGGPQTIYAKRSTDGGRTWSAAVSLSKAGEESTAPAVESGLAGDVRAWWYQTNGGNVDAWNIWYRRSTDGGATWSAAVKISDATSGAGYKTAAGFKEVYGDYGEIAINSAGKAIAIWGEGFSYTGPGGVWLNREQ